MLLACLSTTILFLLPSLPSFLFFFFFFFNDTATTEIYTLSLHDALPIWRVQAPENEGAPTQPFVAAIDFGGRPSCAQGPIGGRSEEHTSELQSLTNLVCRLLLEKKNKHTLNPLLVIYNLPRRFGTRQLFA